MKIQGLFEWDSVLLLVFEVLIKRLCALQCVAVCCSVLHVLQCAAGFCSVLQCVAVCCSVCCSVLQRVLQCAA